MRTIKGIWDGKHVQLQEELVLPPDTVVDVLIPHSDEDAGPTSESDKEELYWRRLVELGLIKERRPLPTEDNDPFTPIPNSGEPISETIIRERR